MASEVFQSTRKDPDKAVAACLGSRAMLQEAALREVIWQRGASTRRLEAAFQGQRGLLCLEDFVAGLERIGISKEDIKGKDRSD